MYPAQAQVCTYRADRLRSWVVTPSPLVAGRVILLLDPTEGREATARYLAGLDDWQVLAVDTGRADELASAVEGLAHAIRAGRPLQRVELVAVVTEARHGLGRPDGSSPPVPLEAPQLLIWLESQLELDGVEVVLYTADRDGLEQARLDWDFSRRSRRPRPKWFAASVQRDAGCLSDLALAQLLERLVLTGPLPSSGDRLPF